MRESRLADTLQLYAKFLQEHWVACIRALILVAAADNGQLRDGARHS